MNKEQTERMLYFLYRMSMYIHPVNKETIAAFMHGVDVGLNQELLWTDLLKRHIGNVYQLYGRAEGWPRQVQLYAEGQDLDWVKAFVMLMEELLENSDQIAYPESLVDKFSQKRLKK